MSADAAQADRELAERLCFGMSDKAIGEAAMLIARHRQSHSLPGDGMRAALTEAADKFDKLAASMREEEADLLAPEIAVSELGRDECLAALTPSALSGDAGEVEKLRADLDEANRSIVSFAAPWAVTYARDLGLPEGHLHPTHYDILAKAGGRMDDFTRAALPSHQGAE